MYFEREEVKRKLFDQLDEGDCFISNDVFYMKVDQINGHNAVCLEDGGLCHFNDVESVTEIYVTLKYKEV